MKGKISADSSFYICNAFNLNNPDRLKKYLDLYQFHAGPIILDEEIKDLKTQYPEIYKKIIRVENPYSNDYSELFKPLSNRNIKHLKEDGEYEAMGIAVELSLVNELKYLIIDDNGPKNFSKTKVTGKYPELTGKVTGTVGFIRDCHINDSLITKDECTEHLKAIHRRFLEYQKNGGEHRPCSMDEKFVSNILLPLIKEMEQTNE